MQRYREGRKGDAAISALQALGGPIGFGAGVVNYIKNRTAISQQTAPAETQPKTEQKPSRKVSKKTQPDVSKGSGGGKEPPKKKTTTQPSDDGGDKTPKEIPNPVDSSVQKGIDYQIAKDVTDNARKTLGKIFNPKNLQTKKRTRTGRRSAG